MSTARQQPSASGTGEATPGRIPLTRERVVAAGVGLADDHGVAWLSMRKLATELGFEVMSLYNHVGSKDDLFEAMVELVAGEVDRPAAGAPWKTGIRTMAMSTREMLLRHPWAVELWTRAFPGPTRFALMDRLLELLISGGFAGPLGDLAFHAVNNHVVGFTQQQLEYRMDATAAAAMSARFAREVTADRFPYIVAHKRFHDDVAAGPGVRPDEFGYVLDLILDGLERARDTTPAGR